MTHDDSLDLFSRFQDAFEVACDMSVQIPNACGKGSRWKKPFRRVKKDAIRDYEYEKACSRVCELEFEILGLIYDGVRLREVEKRYGKRL